MTNELKWREERPFLGLRYFITVRAKRSAVIVRGWFRWYVLIGGDDRPMFWRLQTAKQWVQDQQEIPDPRGLQPLLRPDQYQDPP